MSTALINAKRCGVGPAGKPLEVERLGKDCLARGK